MRLSVSAFRAFCAGALTAAYAASFIGAAALPAGAAQRPAPLYDLTLKDGSHAVVYRNGHVETTAPDGDKSFSLIPLPRTHDEVYGDAGLPDKNHLAFELSKEPPTHPWVEGRIIVVLRDGVSASSDSVKIASTTLHALAVRRAGTAPSAALVPTYTNDSTLNRTFASMGVSHMERLFQHINRSRLSSMRSSAQQSTGKPLINIANAYRVDVTDMPLRKAVTLLLKSPSVAYASPDWRVGTMNANGTRIPRTLQLAAKARAERMPSSRRLFGHLGGADLPQNYASSTSLQSMLNAPAINAMTAFDLIKSSYGQLPGQGETITNVSLGDVDDGSETDVCGSFASAYGPTTSLIGGQRYVNWPAMPLIPAYVSDINGNVFGSGPAACGIDPFLAEVGLDFAVMAPLPHELQRPAEPGNGFTDLLGIAPGASYRLVVPESTQDVGDSDINAAFLAAASQNPRPDVITASLGFGIDTIGFPSRYLEDDPLTQAVVASIVNNYNIVVCISSGDGTRLYTNVAVGPSGGSVPTGRVTPGGTPTDLNDVALSTTPSMDFDSGAIDVGGTTLDDIYAAPPQFPNFRALTAQHAFPETRYTGFTSFSSGFGSRVDVSAPSDNIIAFEHQANYNGPADAINVVLEGGTSASAPEVAAAAAIVLQVGRLTGHAFQSPLDVRKFLHDTGTAVPGAPESDVYNQVGPQINIGNAVETLLKTAGQIVKPAVARVAIEQRKNFAIVGGFLGDTDPGYIDLQGPISSVDGTNTDRNEKAWITMAPDWEGLPAGVQYQLAVSGKPSTVLATSPWARLLPETILGAAGYPLASPLRRTVTLTYRAYQGLHTIAQTTFSLTFSPADPTTRAMLAPTVPAETSASTIPVTYDLSNLRNVQNPTLLVSSAGRVNPGTGLFFYPVYSLPLTQLSGTVQIPVSALQGGGIYGIGINYGSINGNALYSDFAYTRVGISSATSTALTRPPAPLLASGGSTPGHTLQIDYGQPIDVTWDARNVSGATGAFLEISAPGPNGYDVLNPFNNPNGSKPDKNGIDSGSVATIPLSGLSGTMRIDPVASGVLPTFNQTMRIIATSGGSPIGEAGDVSTIAMNGIMTADGGSPFLGFAINQQGTDGLLTSNAYGRFASIQSFDQVTQKVTRIVDKKYGDATGFPLDELIGGPLYHNDVALSVQAFLQSVGGFRESGLEVNPVTGGTLTSWTLPSTPISQSLNYGIGAGENVDDSPAFMSRHWPFNRSNRWFVFKENIPSNTIGPTYEITNMDTACGFAFFYQFAQNTTTNTAVITSACGNIVLLNLTDGTHQLMVHPPQATGFITTMGLAVDSTTNKIAVTTHDDDALTIYDLNTGTSTQTITPGTVGWSQGGATIANDPVNHLFVVLQPYSGDLRDNVVLSNMLTYDENGNLLKVNHSFNQARFNFRLGRNMVQLNPSTRTGFVLDNGQIQSFKY